MLRAGHFFRDLCLCGKTTKVQFKQAFTSQKEIAKEIIAFANSKGGCLLFGVEDKTGKLVGLTYDQIQHTSRELGNAAQEQVRPTIYIETEVVRFEGKHFLVCSVAETPSVKKSRARLSQDEPRGLTK